MYIIIELTSIFSYRDWLRLDIITALIICLPPKIEFSSSNQTIKTKYKLMHSQCDVHII